MEIFELSILTVTLSISGALAPGPLTISAIIHGYKSKFSGFKVAAGHIVFELPYAFLLTYLFAEITTLLSIPAIKYILEFFLFLFILYFSFLTIRDGVNILKGRTQTLKINIKFPPFLTGLILTGLNPYFLIWWSSVGIVLIKYCLNFGFPQGYFLMYLFHFWIDILWIGLMGYLGNKGAQILNKKAYAVVLILLALLMLYFGAYASYKLFK